MKTYQPGSLVRVADICGDPSAGKPGLVAVSRVTWRRWVRTGLVPPGRKIGTRTTVWPIETVLAIGRSEVEASL